MLPKNAVDQVNGIHVCCPIFNRRSRFFLFPQLQRRLSRNFNNMMQLMINRLHKKLRLIVHDWTSLFVEFFMPFYGDNEMLTRQMQKKKQKFLLTLFRGNMFWTDS